jgi:hypothetical protein
MEVLFVFFRWVASFSHVTTDVGSRMDIPNLARVIAPNILISNSKDPIKDDSFSAIRAVEQLLESYEEFCMVIMNYKQIFSKALTFIFKRFPMI